MQTNWDIFIFNPIVLVLIMVFYILMLIKNHVFRSNSQKIFFAQTFCFWFALSLILSNNYDFNFTLKALKIDKLSGLGALFVMSTLFYALIAMIPIKLIFLFPKKKVWEFYRLLVYIAIILGVLLLVIYPSFETQITACVLLGLGVTNLSSFYLTYNEIFAKKFFPFKTVSLVAPIMTFAILAGIDFHDIFTYSLVNKISNHGIIRIIGSLSLLSIFTALFFYFFYSRQGEFTSLPFTAEQREILEPFKWKKVIIIFVLLFFIIGMKEVSQSNIYIWLLGQRTWEKYHNSAMVDQFIRLNNQLFLIPQVFGSYLACNWLYNKLGAKYCFGIGLLLWFAFFTISAFNHSPDAYLALQLINGLAYSMCYYILFAMTCEWKYRSPTGEPIVGYFQILLFGTEFLVRCVDDILSWDQIGIFAFKNPTANFVTIGDFANFIDDITTIVFTSCASLILVLLLIFYFTADFILAEYRNHLVLLVPKINILLRNSFKNKLKSKIIRE
ncbi:hypothetical protein P344_05170 [Spiroplasma mirum ATCC 29335]|uniref:Transmembrane protein n=1 Tax=Spiroplasma mirum ATCC 29335 TaxID=838561 RepID=W0GRJ5_9MOLU|nr:MULTISPECIES: hypothetical protein [Spiroplasma]AHF61254.1 putative transmembrane protein [Spiroplasma mirum ATCC 29335]AHI58356.1 hypothetical protein P344_05170 [Spiroplasma mirum ATCC 29335]AKM53322.1 hypothetical protein SATRI_v1c09330 [Spiroplasma atrichopogonis]